MTSVEDAARDLAAAEAQRARAWDIRMAADHAFWHADEAFEAAGVRVNEALAALVTAVHPPEPERVVKRPAQTSDTLLGLDDVGGR